MWKVSGIKILSLKADGADVEETAVNLFKEEAAAKTFIRKLAVVDVNIYIKLEEVAERGSVTPKNVQWYSPQKLKQETGGTLCNGWKYSKCAAPF